MCDVCFPLPRPAYDAIVDVDINRPERNREVMVVGFTNVEESGVLHDGFDIFLEGNMQDFVCDRYKARHIGDNGILIEMPAATTSYLENFGQFFKHQKHNGSICERQQEGHAIARNAILGDKQRKIKRILLCFPSHIVLSRHYLSKDPWSTSEELNCDLVRFDDTFSIMDKECPNWVCVVMWKVAVHEDERRIVSKPYICETTAMAKISQLIKSMHIV